MSGRCGWRCYISMMTLGWDLELVEALISDDTNLEKAIYHILLKRKIDTAHLFAESTSSAHPHVISSDADKRVLRMDAVPVSSTPTIDGGAMDLSPSGDGAVSERKASTANDRFSCQPSPEPLTRGGGALARRRGRAHAARLVGQPGAAPPV